MRAAATRTASAISAVLAVVLVLGLSTAGCGTATKLVAIAVDVLGPDPFFELHIGNDESTVEPGPNGGIRSGGQAGLYGGSLKKRTCDKAKIIKYLVDPANARKAVAWAGVRGISVKNIAGYIKRLTPVILRNDTRVRNHGFRNGVATVLDVLLEAGIAVMVDVHGEPVVKCNCGNPLSEPIKGATDFNIKVDIPNKIWKRRYNKKKVTVITPRRTKRIRRFYLADIVTGQGIGRPAGTDASHDVRLPAPPAPPPPLAKATPAIIGTWRASSSDIAVTAIEVSQTGDDTFVGVTTDEQKVSNTCTLEARRRVWQIKGKDTHYTGTTPFLNPITCGVLKQLPTVWDIQDPDTMKICIDSDQGQRCGIVHRATG